MENEYRRGSKKERWTCREEEKVWVGFYRRVADPAVAADLIEQMEADKEVKARHLGLYLACRQSLRHEKACRARARAAAYAVKGILHIVFVRPGMLIHALWHFLSAVFNAWLMPSDEPAVMQMRKIRRSQTAQKVDGSAKGPSDPVVKQA